jgi:hypothetical protein
MSVNAEAHMYELCIPVIYNLCQTGSVDQHCWSGGVLLYISRLFVLYHLFIIFCLCIIVSSGIVFIYVCEH